MENKEYMLTVKIPFVCVDDVDARLKAKKFLANIDMVVETEKFQTKLQEMYKNKAPRGL